MASGWYLRKDWSGLLFERRRSALVLSLAGTALVGALDYVTGVEVRVYALYFVPLCVGAWFSSAGWTFVLTALCAFTWTLSNHLSGLSFESPWAWPLNVAFNLIGFGTVGYLVNRLRTSLGRERLMSRTDSLTSLWNGRVLAERIRAEIDRQQRSGRAFALAYMDLDDFKAVNDMRGHPAGDAVLRRFGEALRSASRSTDTAARLGGDEFALLMPETGIEEASAGLSRLHEALSALLSAEPSGSGFSLGAVVFDSPPASAEDAIKAADSVMYQVKNSGKSRMEIRPAQEVSCSPCEPAGCS